VKQGVTPVSGTVTYNSVTNTATFNPDAALGLNLVYTATVTTGAEDTGGLPLAANYVWSFTTIAAAPTVTSTSPSNAATGVAVNTNVTATFSKAMDATTITSATFSVKQGLTPVSGVVTYNGATNTATFNPDASLGLNLVYTATVTIGAKDTGDIPLAADHVWSFTTVAAPTVTSTSPLNAASGVAVGTNVTATFSKAMDATTISSLTFTVKQGITPVSGAVTYNALTNTATFNPSASLAPGLVFTVTVTTGAKDTGGIPLAADHVWSFATAAAAPTVIFTSPLDGATGVAVNTNVIATFSKAMDATTITSLTFTVKQGLTPVAGVVTYNGATNTATFNPSSSLGLNLVYTATVTTGAKDMGGLPLVTDHVWSFTTTATAPTVIATNPLNVATGVALNTSITATFSKAMNATTISSLTFTVKQGLTPVSGIVTLNALTNTATFNPDAALSPGLLYTATITTGAEDTGGLPLAADYIWSFTTATPPTVTSTSPLNGAVDVSIMNRPTATFSRAMNPATISSLTFTLKQGLTPVSGAVTYNGVTNTATFTPTAALGLNLVYTATVTTGAKDVGGVPLSADYIWSFTTGACSLEPVVLGGAGNFAVLGGSTVTNVVSAGTSITGDVGLWSGSAVTGFPPGVIIGTLHVTDPTAAAAQSDLTTAYNDAAGRTLCPVTLTGANLGGMTLYPGLYWSASSLEISSGDLYLDAQGDENAVFIFQMGSTLTTTAGRQVILAGGAKAANIFWQVGTSATLGTTSHMEGTIMADQSISMLTGATLNGRVLARIGAITLDSNVIVKPTP